MKHLTLSVHVLLRDDQGDVPERTYDDLDMFVLSIVGSPGVIDVYRDTASRTVTHDEAVAANFDDLPERCDACSGTGILEMQGKAAPVPDGWVAIERCDACALYEGDQEAAKAFQPLPGFVVSRTSDLDRDVIALKPTP